MVDVAGQEASRLVAEAVEPGTSYELALSSLIMSGVPSPDTEVRVQFDEAQIASAPIDPTIVDTFDEQGRATVSFALPSDAAAGTHFVAFRLASSGLCLSFPVQVGDPAVGQPSAVDPCAPVTPPVTGPGGSDPAGNGEPTPAGAAAGDKLAATGVEFTVPLAASGALLALGALLMLRRRRELNRS
jgi:5'-nucleotidase